MTAAALLMLALGVSPVTDGGTPGVESDAQAAVRFQISCDKGEAAGCIGLATLAWQGRGVKADPKRAFKLYLRACDLGDGSGCFSAAVCHRSGACAKKSAGAATKLFRRGCAAGDKRACGEVPKG